jgi:hypothetical protein
MRLFVDTPEAEAKAILAQQAKWLVEIRGSKAKASTGPSKVITPTKVPAPPTGIQKGKAKELALLKPKPPATPVGEKRKETTTSTEDEPFEVSLEPHSKKLKVPKKKIPRKTGKPFENLPNCLKGLALVSAQEGSQRLQASQQQEVVKATKEKVDKKKAKAKAKAKGKGKRKGRQAVETPDLEIPPAIKASIQEAQKKKRTIQASGKKPRKLPAIFKVAEDVLTRLKPFRSKHPIKWDPLDLKDPPTDTGVRTKDEEHVQRLAETQWAEKQQPKVVEWIVFQFNVRSSVFSS